MKKVSLWKITSRANAQGRTEPCLALCRVFLDYPPLKGYRIEKDGEEYRVYAKYGKKEYIFSRNGNKKWEV